MYKAEARSGLKNSLVAFVLVRNRVGRGGFSDNAAVNPTLTIFAVIKRGGRICHCVPVPSPTVRSSVALWWEWYTRSFRRGVEEVVNDGYSGPLSPDTVCQCFLQMLSTTEAVKY